MTDEELVVNNLALVKFWANRMATFHHVLEFDDMVGYGNIGLVQASRTWRPEKSKFSTHASIHIRYAILDEIRRRTHRRTAYNRKHALPVMVSLETITHRPNGSNWDPFPDDDPESDVQATAELRVLAQQVRNCIPMLTPAQRNVITRLLDGKTLAEISRENGKSGNSSSEAYRIALRTLRRRIIDGPV